SSINARAVASLFGQSQAIVASSAPTGLRAVRRCRPRTWVAKQRSDFLARNGWQAEAELTIVDHGGCGSVAGRAGWSRHPIPMQAQNFAPQPSVQIRTPLNKMG